MFYDNLKTHRIAAGIKIAELARLAGIGESTIRRIEKHDPSTEETLMKIVNALNYSKKYENSNIDPKREITQVSRFGGQKQRLVTE